MSSRLTPIDASFLGLERDGAHMHVGWLALFNPPEGREAPRFEDVRAHIAARLPRAPRYRQRLQPVPLDVAEPVWVDDDRFDLDEHVRHARLSDPVALIDEVTSTPLRRDIPLWEIWVADELADGRLALVGKAHHCMVDGIAMVQLASMLLHPEPEPDVVEEDHWSPSPAPGRMALLTEALTDRVGAAVSFAGAPLRLALDPRRALAAARRTRQVAGTLASALSPAPVAPALGAGHLSPRRHLALLRRDLDELRAVKRRFGTTLNDVVLAVAAGGLRSFSLRRDSRALPLKALVPVSVRADDDTEGLGNRVSFVFVELPCDVEGPVERLRAAHRAASATKRGGDAETAVDALGALELVPPALQRPLSRLAAGRRTFNLAVSNIPGPREPLYMLGCRLTEAYPVVPIAEEHALSIGFTSIGAGAFFGIYADPRALPEADELAADVDAALDDLVAAAARPRGSSRFRPQDSSGSSASSLTSVSASSAEGSEPDTMPQPE